MASVECKGMLEGLASVGDRPRQDSGAWGREPTGYWLRPRHCMRERNQQG